MQITIIVGFSEFCIIPGSTSSIVSVYSLDKYAEKNYENDIKIQISRSAYYYKSLINKSTRDRFESSIMTLNKTVMVLDSATQSLRLTKNFPTMFSTSLGILENKLKLLVNDKNSPFSNLINAKNAYNSLLYLRKNVRRKLLDWENFLQNIGLLDLDQLNFSMDKLKNTITLSRKLYSMFFATISLLSKAKEDYPKLDSNAQTKNLNSVIQSINKMKNFCLTNLERLRSEIEQEN